MIEKLSNRIYYSIHQDETDRPSLGIVKGTNGCLIIDSGNSPRHAQEIMKEMKSLNLPDTKYLVLTHHHWDHIFGLKEWNVPTIASKKTYEYIKTYCNLNYDDASLQISENKKIFQPSTIKAIMTEIEDRESFHPSNCNIIYEKEMTIDLGGITCYIRELISPHTDDSTIVYIPEEKILFLGDGGYGCISHGFNYYNREKTIQLMNTIEQYPADYYLFSHEPICTREELLLFWDQLQMGLLMTEDSKNIEESIERFKVTYHIEPNEEEIFIMKSFGIGESWGRSGELERDIF